MTSAGLVAEKSNLPSPLRSPIAIVDRPWSTALISIFAKLKETELPRQCPARLWS